MDLQVLKFEYRNLDFETTLIKVKRDELVRDAEPWPKDNGASSVNRKGRQSANARRYEISESTSLFGSPGE